MQWEGLSLDQTTWLPRDALEQMGFGKVGARPGCVGRGGCMGALGGGCTAWRGGARWVRWAVGGLGCGREIPIFSLSGLK